MTQLSLIGSDEPIRAKNRLFGRVFITGFFLLVALVWSKLPRFDAPAYFDFADHRAFFGISNTMDVLSNLGFLWVGVHWWKILSRVPANDKNLGLSVHVSIYRFIAVASILTALGSAWFHWTPNIERLFWDRLPMTLGFSGMIALLVADRFDIVVGKKLAVVLVVLSVVHLILWNFGLSNLRPYIVLQYGGVLLGATLLCIRWKWGILSSRMVLFAFLLYVAAKVTEVKDVAIFEGTGGVVSGHTIKHLLAALAIDRLFAAGTQDIKGKRYQS